MVATFWYQSIKCGFPRSTGCTIVVKSLGSALKSIRYSQKRTTLYTMLNDTTTPTVSSARFREQYVFTING
uniref:Uncharacterized protein n=1 Tax=Caenorhabditis japonica TaxID=281687 RepID=A0A8R1ITI5_CAEJA